MSAAKSQLSLHLPAPRLGWGGRRAGAGRPKKPGAKTTVPHGRRPYHDARHPTHVTVRVRRRVGNLRRWHVAQAVGLRLRHHATSEAAPAARRRRTFRVIHFSIQSKSSPTTCT
jgi:hypothetical protein